MAPASVVVISVISLALTGLDLTIGRHEWRASFKTAGERGAGRVRFWGWGHYMMATIKGMED